MLCILCIRNIAVFFEIFFNDCEVSNMKYSNISGRLVIFALAIATTSVPLFAKNETALQKNFRENAVGIATSSVNMQHIKEKLLKLRTESSSISSGDSIVQHYKKRLESK